MRSLSLTVLCTLTAVSSSFQAQAQQPQAKGWGAGIAVISQREGYRGADTDTMVIPVAFYEGEKLYWRGPEVGFKLSDNFTLLGEYRFDGFDDGDSDFFEGMEKRKGTFDLGFSYEFELGPGELEIGATMDVLGEHEGYEFGASYGVGFPAFGGMISPFVEVSYLSDDLVDYYYGVRASEVTESRGFYEGSNTINYGFGVSGFWRINENQNVIANINYEILGSDIEDSPLMEEGESAGLFVAWSYNF